MKKNRKYIFVVGGVMSAVGKGIASSSIGVILKARGFNVTAIKIDPYINVDAGTMNPTVHGEVFVLNDGDETDQDMGNYERFMGIDLTRTNYMTTGRVYQEVIRKERNLEYGGRDVEVVPDIPEEVIRRIKKAGEDANADIVITEIGGTIGEYQNLIFLEAARMMKTEFPDDVAFVMVSYLPTPSSVGEMKTKPTQYAARTLNGVGIQADIIVARGDRRLDEKRKQKIARFCNIRQEHVISAPDVKSIYDVPINFEKDNLGEMLTEILDLPKGTADLSKWKTFVRKSNNTKKEVKIGVVGKYFSSGEYILADVYISVLEAVKAASYHQGAKPIIDYIDSTDFEKNPTSVKKLEKYDGVLIPGGFGKRGIEGKLRAVRYVRENKIPYFGLCYGMQMMVIEYARNVLGWEDANTREINPRSKHLVIDLMESQVEILQKQHYGGSMRLGEYPAKVKKGTLAEKAYGVNKISERHRHRYEVNPDYIEDIEKAGLVFSATSPDGTLMEIAELPRKDHPFFLGTQFHPEFQSRPLSPHPLFSEFIRSAIKRQAK